MPHEMNEDEKCSKNRRYGLFLVLRGKIAVGGCVQRNNMCFSRVQLHDMAEVATGHLPLLLITHPVMTWKAGRSANAKNHKVKNRNITGGGDGGYPRLTRGVDDAEFFPLA